MTRSRWIELGPCTVRRFLRGLLLSTCLSMIGCEEKSTTAPDPGESAPVLPSDLVFSGGLDGQWDIFLRRASDSDLVNLTDDPLDDTQPAWSPDGTHIAFVKEIPVGASRPLTDLWVMNSEGQDQVNLTQNEMTIENSPVWSPDGSRIAFIRRASRDSAVMLIDPDGGNLTELMGDLIGPSIPSWSPDGSTLAFSSETADGALISFVAADGSGRVDHFGTFFGHDPVFSFDGSRIAYLRMFASDIVVRMIDTEASEVVTTGKSIRSRLSWSPDGRWLVGSNARGASSLVLVDIETASAREIPAGGATWKWPRFAPDGRSLVMVESVSGQSSLVVTTVDGAAPRLVSDATVTPRDYAWQYDWRP